MTARTMTTTASMGEGRRFGLSLIERYLLMRAHPRRIILDVVSLMWATYFLWLGNWQVALGIVVVLSALGMYLTKDIDFDEMSNTVLGRLATLHSHPINLALNLIGVIPLVYGVYLHSTEAILAGLSIVVLGHFFGWSEVHPSLDID